MSPRREAEVSSTRTKPTNERVEEIEEFGLTVGIVNAYCEEFGGDVSSVSLADVSDAFEGTYSDHESFAKEFAKGSLLHDVAKASWPATCIDWVVASSELMQTFTEIDGYYFGLG
jgi:hypothetical protein